MWTKSSTENIVFYGIMWTKALQRNCIVIVLIGLKVFYREYGNARIAKELNELEHLLKEREYETHNPSDVEEERETTLQETEEEEERELEVVI
ncbi:Hypothetical predicted protein [Mytilus galloprovincialis]|uniref:Uncharacterized protein n=1 Tax=Mytilus galloprovincialis TaxID=29158 RepID=A0A8B6CV12_MYTGA|nr:Hypothetical predicted protein [Mytilus galloprovincialis]